jgi:hypothetical protein
MERAAPCEKSNTNRNRIRAMGKKNSNRRRVAVASEKKNKRNQ